MVKKFITCYSNIKIAEDKRDWIDVSAGFNFKIWVEKK